MKFYDLEDLVTPSTLLLYIRYLLFEEKRRDSPLMEESPFGKKSSRFPGELSPYYYIIIIIKKQHRASGIVVNLN
jgi:hypothetical protein